MRLPTVPEGIDRANLGVNLAVIGLTASAIVYIFSNFVTLAQFNDYAVEHLYDQFYETVDRIKKAETENEESYAEELRRRLERLRAKICEVEPNWERCEKK